MSDGAVFDNLGTFLDQSEGGGEFTYGSGASSSFNNQGSFLTQSINGGVSLFSEGVSFNVAGGTVDVQDDYLELFGGGTDTGAAYTIESGEGLEFSGSTPFTLDGGTTFSGAGNLLEGGEGGTLTIAGNSPSFTGPTTVQGGTLLVDGSLAGSAISVKPLLDYYSTLGGTGTVGAVTTTGYGSVVSPGDNGPGILNAQGNVAFESLSTFQVELDGATAGTGFSQLNVTGAVNLGGSILSSSLGFTPTNGETFTIIQSTAPIVGTFNGLAEGASLTIGAVPFQISYAGGGGDDVVLTQSASLLATTTTVVSSENLPTRATW
jgi:autotransporter-associated beta strand protein